MEQVSASKEEEMEEKMVVSPVKGEEKEPPNSNEGPIAEEMNIPESKEDEVLSEVKHEKEQKEEEIKNDKAVHLPKLTEEEIEFLATPIIEYTNSKKRLLESDFVFRPTLNIGEDGKEIEEAEIPHHKKRLIYSTALPSKPDYNIRWTERVASYYVPSASYTYEVQYSIPKHYPLGFTVQWQHIPYSHNTPHKTLLVCAVKTVADHFHTAIAVGDIILKMNDETLVYKPGDPFNEKRLLTLFTPNGFNQLSNLTSLRFLRAGSTCNGCIPSVAEILLLLNEKHSGAKYNVKTNMKDGQEYYGLELIQMDNQLPSSVKKLLQSQKISWQHIPILSIGSAQANYLITANLAPPTSSMASSVIGPMTLNHTTPLYSIHSPQLEEIMQPGSDSFMRSGVYRERSKYVVIYVDRSKDITASLTVSLEPIPAMAEQPEFPRIYHLGRYDNEEEARKAYHRVLQSVEITGSFNLQHYLLGYQKSNIQIIKTEKIGST